MQGTPRFRISLRFALLVICAMTAGATAGLAWHTAHVHAGPAPTVRTVRQ